jgi:hypothetical protein
MWERQVKHCPYAAYREMARELHGEFRDVTLPIERAKSAILPSQRMMALVSGLAKEDRQDRLFMVAVYQAFVDDSDAGASGPFVLAGFVSSIETWAQFADDWRAKLFNAKPRPLAYFKAKEAAARRGQFDGWTIAERDSLVHDQLLPLIDRAALFGIGCLIDNDAYHRVFHKRLARSMDYPYTLAFYGVMQSLFTVQRQQGFLHPVDFIFDEQGKQIGRALEAWKHFVEAASPEDKARMGRRPISGDDKVDIPLQAADLLAWRMRREWMDKESGNDTAVKLFPLQVYVYCDVWTEEKLQGQMGGVSAILKGQRPEVPL